MDNDDASGRRRLEARGPRRGRRRDADRPGRRRRTRRPGGRAGEDLRARGCDLHRGVDRRARGGRAARRPANDALGDRTARDDSHRGRRGARSRSSRRCSQRSSEIAREYDVVIATVGHAGDGNLHPSIVWRRERAEGWPAAEAVFRAALELGGTITGEHGIGTLKRPWLAEEIGEVGMAVHRSVKATFDPLGILNPGKGV